MADPHDPFARASCLAMDHTGIRAAQNDIMLRINQLFRDVQDQGDETNIVCAREALRTISRVATKAMADLDIAIAHLQQQRRDALDHEGGK